MKKFIQNYPIAAGAIAVGIIALIIYAIRQSMRNGNGNTARTTRLGWQKAYTRVAPVIPTVAVFGGTVTPRPSGGVGARVSGGGSAGVK